VGRTRSEEVGEGSFEEEAVGERKVGTKMFKILSFIYCIYFLVIYHVHLQVIVVGNGWRIWRERSRERGG
jgi:hypothetical protein